MAVTYNANVMGKMKLTHKGEQYEVEIRQGNCLAVFIYLYDDEEGVKRASLQMFFADEQHLKNICKSVDNGEYKDIFGYDKVNEIRLNMRYKESATMLKHLVKYYEINCYYE